MLMQSKGPLARRCSIYWRLGCSTLLMAALIALSGTLGVRGTAAQALAPQVADKKNPDEKAAAAEERDIEVAKLRAQQEQIRAQLESLEAEKQQLQAELERRKAEGTATNDLTGVYKRTLAQRDQAAAQAKRAEAAHVLAQIAAKNDETAPDRDKAAKDEKQALKDWMGKKYPDARGDQKEFSGRAQLDLVSLANNYTDAIGNLQIAQLEFDRLNGKPKVFTEYEVNRAKLEVVRAQRKVQIFRAIAEAALESAKTDLEIANRNVKFGLGPENAVNEAKSRVRIIEVILAQ